MKARKLMKRSLRTAGIAELKASLSEYLRKVKSGEEVLVLEHGKPVARLVPCQLSGPSLDSRLRLAKTGVARLGTDSISARDIDRMTIVKSSASVVKVLLEEREQSW